MNTIVKCSRCKQILEEPCDLAEADREPCQACGSLSRRYECEIEESVFVHDFLKAKAMHKGSRKPFRETRVGNDLHRKTGRWMKLERVIDRENDLYEEVVTDPDTGEVVHKCVEPLSKHQGHGSTKHRESKEIDDHVTASLL